MVACPKCTLNNTLDSLFCRKCGAVLPQSVIQEEQQKLVELVSKGMTSFEAGKTEEAMMIADHAIMTNPSYAEAFALKGMVHERKGEYAEALDAYETVVGLNPDSTIDKIKLNQLRNAFAQRKAGAPAPDRKAATLMAVAATLLIMSVGAITLRLVNGSTSKDTTALTNPTNSQPQVGKFVNQNAGGQQVVNNAPPAQNVDASKAVNSQNPPVTNDEVGALSQRRVDPPTRTASRFEKDRSGSGRSLPDIGSGGTVVGPAPVVGTIGQGALPNPTSNRGNVPRPVEDRTNNTIKKDNDDPPTRPTPGLSNQESQGTMEISISSGSNQNKSKGNQAGEVLNRTGNEKMKSGDVEGAAKAFEGATRAGASSGKTHQRQAQALARQGKSGEASAAYRRAIDAYEADIRSGKGNRETNEAGLASCRAALKQLG